MKWQIDAIEVAAVASLPVRGAWIEMLKRFERLLHGFQSLPVRGAWIEMRQMRKLRTGSQSLPVRGAWIEMPFARVRGS